MHKTLILVAFAYLLDSSQEAHLLCSSDWMKHLPLNMTRIPISQIAIPGTHDSGSYGIKDDSPVSTDLRFGWFINLFGIFINTKLSEWSVTQSADFEQQLQAGIRYFDMRIIVRRDDCNALPVHSSAINDSTMVALQTCLYLTHGQYANRVVDELNTIQQFLQQHSKEVIIIDFQHFHDFDSVLKLVFQNLIEKTFGDLLEPFSYTLPTIGDMWSRKKQVFVLGDERYKHNVEEGVSIIWPRASISQPWADTRSPEKLVSFLTTQNMKWMGSARRNKFFVFQGVLSPNLDHVLERFDDGLRKLASQANNAVAKWLSGLRRLQGIVITDFSIYDYPNFSRSVFSMNWKQP